MKEIILGQKLGTNVEKARSIQEMMGVKKLQTNPVILLTRGDRTGTGGFE